jgi:peptide-methionine (S)-S-oxide reductase
MKNRIIFLLLFGLIGQACGNAQHKSNTNAEKNMKKNENPEAIPTDEIEIATLGGGCFWCVEAVYQEVEGVYSVVSGYSGGTPQTANYKDVSEGTTAHAEVVQVKFNPKVVSFDEILEIFWSTHDPTTRNRQGNDVGPQYRSVIFYQDETQKQIAEKSKAGIAPQLWENPIVTEIKPLKGFWEAEDYHQDYYSNVGDRNPYCTFVITPKMAKFRKTFSDKLKKN